MKVKTKDLLLALKLLTSVIKPNKLKPVTELIEFKDSYLYMTDNISSMSYKLNCDELCQHVSLMRLSSKICLI